MSNLCVMSAKRPKEGKDHVRINTRTSNAIDATLKKVHANVAFNSLLSSRRLGQEVFIVATWLWMDTIDPAEIATGILPYISTVEAARDAAKEAEDKAKAEKAAAKASKGKPAPLRAIATRNRNKSG
jgi:hypothetical protein